MKNNLIRSESSLKRYPALAFLLSILFTGMGQAYNGELSKGFIFIILRILSLLIIPFYAASGRDVSTLFFLIIIAAGIFVWIASTGESFFSARAKKTYNLKKYNSVLFYFLYGIFFSLLMILSLLVNFAFFSFKIVDSDNMSPYLRMNDYILINKYLSKTYGIGDVVIFSLEGKKEAGRIVGREGDIVSKKNNHYYINSNALPHGLLSAEDAGKFSINNTDDVFFETNGVRKYPVILKPGKDGQDIKPVLLATDEFLIVFDNRINNDSYYIINPGMIQGRVEGIIFSRDFGRILNKAHLKAE